MAVTGSGLKMNVDNSLLILSKEVENGAVQHILEYFQTSKSCWTFYRVTSNVRGTLQQYAADEQYKEFVMVDFVSDVRNQHQLKRMPVMLVIILGHEVSIEKLIEGVRIDNSQCIENGLKIIFENDDMTTTLFRWMSLDNLIQVIGLDSLMKIFRNANFELQIAAKLGNVELVKLLLDQGYEIESNEFLSGQRTSLHIAVINNYLDIVKLLIEYGANVNALDYDKFTPIHYVSCPDGRADVSRKYLEILKVLLSRGALLTTNDRRNMMQVNQILSYGCQEVVNLVLQYMDNLYVIDGIGYTPIHYVALNRNIDVVETLKNRDFDVNVRDRYGKSALTCAAQRHLPKTMKFLLERGADVHFRDNDNDSILYPLYGFFYWHSRERSNLGNIKECVRILLQYDLDPFDHRLNTIFDFVSKVYNQFERDYNRRPNNIVIEPKPNDILTLLEPILVHIAMKKACDLEMPKFDISKVELQASWVEYIENQINIIKKTTIYSRGTLFDFLAKKEKKLIAYVRNKELVTEIEKIIDQDFEKDSICNIMLRERLTAATKSAEVREMAVLAICRIWGWENRADYYAAERIVDYLNRGDAKNLISIGHE